jgi:carboxymethylenebutenolidase
MQEWWGLDLGDQGDGRPPRQPGSWRWRPDLYHGELAGHDEMDKAAQLMQAMPPDRAGRDMSGAVDYLAGLDEVTERRHRRGRVLHGRDARLDHRRNRPTRVGASSLLRLPAGRHGTRLVEARRPRAGPHGRSTTTSSGRAAKALEAKLQGMGKDVTFTVHEGTARLHGAPTNALGTHDAEKATSNLAQACVPARRPG